jgi:hypothetical protein
MVIISSAILSSVATTRTGRSDHLDGARIRLAITCRAGRERLDIRTPNPSYVLGRQNAHARRKRSVNVSSETRPWLTMPSPSSGASAQSREPPLPATAALCPGPDVGEPLTALPPIFVPTNSNVGTGSFSLAGRGVKRFRSTPFGTISCTWGMLTRVASETPVT